MNPEVLWLHNDGGDNRIFAVATNAKLLARLRVPAEIEDIEDIAIGPGPEPGLDFLYLGDIGDNDEQRRDIRIIRFPEPILSTSADPELGADAVEVFRLRYPDGPHDAEALLLDPTTGDVFIATKDERRARLYRVAAASLRREAAAPLELAGYLNVGAVSGGDISRAGNLIALRSEDRGWLWLRHPGEDLAAAMQRAPRRVMTRGRGQGKNGEAIGFSPDGRGYFTVSEGKHEAIYFFPIPPMETR